MFVRVKKIGAYEYLYLVENAREGGRHVQRVIKALGRRDEVEASGLIDGLIASAARHSRRSIVLSSFYRGELAGTAPRQHRTQFGVRPAVGRDRMPRRARQPACRPALRLRCRAGGLSHRTASADGLGLRPPRERMAQRLARPRRRRARRSTRRTRRWPGSAKSTSTAAAPPRQSRKRSIGIASRCSVRCRSPSSIRRRYGSRAPAVRAWVSAAIPRTTEGSLNQVVLGIVLDDADRPIASFLMPGNTADVTMLLPVVERLRDRFGIARACIVADRGMISAAHHRGARSREGRLHSRRARAHQPRGARRGH